jgi:hypothetical protein
MKKSNAKENLYLKTCNEAAGNRTQVYRTTTGGTNHYTTASNIKCGISAISKYKFLLIEIRTK